MTITKEEEQLPRRDAADDDLVLDETDLLLEVVRSIVRRPQDVEIDAVRGKETTVLTITVHQEDRGHVIGRQRQMLDAIILIFSKAAFLEGRKVFLVLGGEDLRRGKDGGNNRGGGGYRKNYGRNRNNNNNNNNGYRPRGPVREYRPKHES